MCWIIIDNTVSYRVMFSFSRFHFPPPSLLKTVLDYFEKNMLEGNVIQDVLVKCWLSRKLGVYSKIGCKKIEQVFSLGSDLGDRQTEKRRKCRQKQEIKHKQKHDQKQKLCHDGKKYANQHPFLQPSTRTRTSSETRVMFFEYLVPVFVYKSLSILQVQYTVPITPLDKHFLLPWSPSNNKIMLCTPMS